MNCEPVNYDDFIDLPPEQWTEWMAEYLRNHCVSGEAFKTLIDITSHPINPKRTQAFWDVCRLVVQAAAKQHEAFEQCVLPIAAAREWEILSQLLVVAGSLEQSVCDALVAPLWSNPASQECFIVLNEKARNGRHSEAHPLLNPKILRDPRLHQKYKMLPMCFISSLNEEYFKTYGVDGLKQLHALGLMKASKNNHVLDHVLCVDTPDFLRAWHSVEPIDFNRLQDRCHMYLNNDNKAVAFYTVFVELSDDPGTAQWVFQNLLELKTNRAPYQHPELDCLLIQLAQNVQWDEAYVGEIVGRCHRHFERCLSLLIDLIPIEHASLINNYFIEGGFEMTQNMEEIKMRAQKIALLQVVEPLKINTARSARKM